jgi:1-acyl-sn-glycerol-3-phosphate acyltransferase
MNQDFRPARPSPSCIALTWRLLPLALRHRKVLRVEIDEADIARLQALKHERVVLTPNHPTNTDPALMVELSRRAKTPFYYLSCREAFDGWRGYWGKLIQRLGAYSVVRGTIDRESFRYTRELLAKPKTKLVIFPEGEVYSQNDSLLPFQVGAIQLALWGQEEARAKEPNARVLLLPVALRYRFAGDVSHELDIKLQMLEEKLQLPPLSRDALLENLYARMRRVAVTILSDVEQEYSLPEVEDADLTPRFLAAKEAALSRAAQLLGEKMPRGSIPERMRVLLHHAESELHELQNDETQDEPLREREARVLRAWRDLERLANWVAIYDGYASSSPTLERLAEVIYRLEADAFGEATFAGTRIATVRVGEPIELPDEISRRELPQWTQQLEDAVRALL